MCSIQCVPCKSVASSPVENCKPSQPPVHSHYPCSRHTDAICLLEIHCIMKSATCQKQNHPGCTGYLIASVTAKWCNKISGWCNNWSMNNWSWKSYNSTAFQWKETWWLTPTLHGAITKNLVIGGYRRITPAVAFHISLPITIKHQETWWRDSLSNSLPDITTN